MVLFGIALYEPPLAVTSVKSVASDIFRTYAHSAIRVYCDRLHSV